MNHNQRSHPPKIAYLLKNFAGLSETFILQEILELERQGLPLRLFSLAEVSGSRPAEAARHVQAPVTYLSRQSLLTLLTATIRRFLKTPWRFLRAGSMMGMHYRRRSTLKHVVYAAYLADQFERENVTHVHAHYATTSASVAQALHLLMGIPYSFTAHAHDIYLSAKTELAYKIRRARFVVTCTTYNQQYLAALVDQHVGERIHRIYHGLNLGLFPSHASVPSQAQACPLILAVSRLIEKKGLPYLLRSCRILKDRGYHFRCCIVGEGPLRQALEQEICALGLRDRVELWGAETHKGVIAMYQQATIMTLPCIISKNGDRDGIPNVLVEALCMSVPVISTPVSGIPELITSEVNGLLVPPNDSTALAAALARLLDDPSLRCRLAAAGRQTVLAKFDMARNTKQLMQLLCTDVEAEIV